MLSKNNNNAHHETDTESNSINWTPDRKECVIKPRALTVVWGNDPRCWIVPEKEGPVELKQVCWLEVRGSIGLETGKKYRIGFKISFKPDAYGWKQAPVFVSAKLGKKGKNLWHKIKSIDQISDSKEVRYVPDDSDGRFEIAVPSDGSSQTMELYFGLYEVWSGKWKGGLLIHEAVVQEVG